MPNLLAIQSHVVHGYVGNKAATFPLQCLNWNVDCLNVVQFSNHTGYGFFVGSTISEKDLNNILEQLTKNFDYDALLTGYLPNKDCVRTVLTKYTEYKNQLNVSNPKKKCLWLLDPVMGDEYHLYVHTNVVPEYKKYLQMNNIDIITPNSFELQLLYNTDLGFIEKHKALPTLITMEEIYVMLAGLHRNVNFIVITSLDNVDVGEEGDRANFIYCLASWHQQSDKKYLFKIPKIKSYFTGVGDLFSSILLNSLYNSTIFSSSPTSITSEEREAEIIYCVNYTLTILQKVLETTIQQRLLMSPGITADIIESASMGGDPMVMKNMELKIIESKNVFLSTEEKNVLNFLCKKITH
ncbi:hypothetical protein ACO0RG_004726 [Hanseniaspora osmophila]|uniref:pyridoxal kinase n=1 Tax=Hanseniaspora osmophila TaxID=56408 RepID=A0A1E5S028_9ASCO|nr:putative pyridoxal kinase BUD16 [Hanseniaspora osmophila]